MTSQLSVFQFQSSYDVRIQLINNEPWFCLKDVCGALDIKNTSQLASQLDERGISKTYTLTNGGRQELIFINEPNLYRVIFRSNKLEAKQFQDWVFNDVLPTIRKTGRYSIVDKSDLINDKQLSDLKYIIYNISQAYFYKESFNQAAWKMLRDVTGVNTVKDITCAQLQELKPCLEKLLRVSARYVNLKRETESNLIKQVFRNNGDESTILKAIEQQHKQLLSTIHDNYHARLSKFEQNLLNELN